ncbi:MAG: ATP-binding protein [Desulfobacterales bacterium]
MKISIASGKGGTGKTTIAVNLAVSIPEDVQLLDCDVEEPNCHLFLDLETETCEKVFAPVPHIDLDKCTFCRKCADICRFKAIAVLEKTVLTFPELCHSCGGCMAVCPENAVTEVGRELGELETGKFNHSSFAHGRLRVGEAMAPPLIKKVKSFIRTEAVNIIDAPPGTSCPVITTIKDTDFVLMVTEPTPFGLHDLKLALGAVRLLGIPHGLVINRAGMGDERVEAYAREENLPILMQIPFDRRIAETYSRGKLIVEEMPEWKERFTALFDNIRKWVR